MEGRSALWPTGVAGSESDAGAAESGSEVGELGADILSVVLSRTASSCRRSAKEGGGRRQIQSRPLR